MDPETHHHHHHHHQLNAPMPPQASADQPTSPIGTENSPPAKPRRRAPMWVVLVASVASGVAAGALGFGLGATVAAGDEPANRPAASQERPGAGDPAGTDEPEEGEEEEPAFEPELDDFELTATILEKKCFGSAGCNLTYRVDLAYGGPDFTGEWELTYEVHGGEDPSINTMLIDEEMYTVDDQERIQTASSDDELTIEAVSIRGR